MLSIAKNELGIRLASATIVFLPIVFLIFITSHSPLLDLIVFLSYSVFAGIALIAFLWEKAEEDEKYNAEK